MLESSSDMKEATSMSENVNCVHERDFKKHAQWSEAGKSASMISTPVVGHRQNIIDHNSF